MLARLASRRAKPGGAFHLLPQDVPEFLAPLDVDNLHGFGYSARQKAQEKLGTTNLGDLAKKSKAVLCDALGKSTGETLYKALRGIDERQLESDKPRKSVSCDINVCCFFVSLMARKLMSSSSMVYASKITSRQRYSFIKWPKKCRGD